MGLNKIADIICYYYRDHQRVDYLDPLGLILPPCTCRSCIAVRKLFDVKDIDEISKEICSDYGLLEDCLERFKIEDTFE